MNFISSPKKTSRTEGSLKELTAQVGGRERFSHLVKTDPLRVSRRNEGGRSAREREDEGTAREETIRAATANIISEAPRRERGKVSVKERRRGRLAFLSGELKVNIDESQSPELIDTRINVCINRL